MGMRTVMETLQLQEGGEDGGRLSQNADDYVTLSTSHHELPWRGVDCSTVSASSSSSRTRSPFGVISPPNRLRATSRIRSAMRGSRSMRTWRSWASSMSRLVRVTAVTVADLRVRRSALTSPKTWPDALVRELDFHCSGRDEIHGMRGLAASGDNVPGLELLRVQQADDIGDIHCLQFSAKGTRATIPQVTTKSRR